MTNDFDDLLSAYIDGQATADEIALVEGDPALMAEAEAMAAAVDRLATELPTPPSGLRQAQIASALAAFDELGPVLGEAPAAPAGGAGGAVVSDLGARRADRERSASRMPAWLGAAAAGLLVVAGVGWVIQSVGSGSDDSDTATADFAADETTEADSDFAETTAVTEDLARDEELEAAEEDAASADDGGAAESAPADEGAQDDSADEASTTTAGGFFPDDEAAKLRDAARLALSSIPGEAELIEIAQGSLLGPELSLCGSQLEPEPSRSLIGMVPISIGDRLGEVLVYEAEDGSGPFPIVVSTELIDGLPVCGPLE